MNPTDFVCKDGQNRRVILSLGIRNKEDEMEGLYFVQVTKFGIGQQRTDCVNLFLDGKILALVEDTKTVRQIKKSLPELKRRK